MTFLIITNSSLVAIVSFTGSVLLLFVAVLFLIALGSGGKGTNVLVVDIKGKNIFQ